MHFSWKVNKTTFIYVHFSLQKLITLILMTITICSAKLIIQDGSIIVAEKNYCNITLNNQYKFINISSSSSSTLYFGYIEYSCISSENEISKGSVTSIAKCKECDFFCRYNDAIPQCRQYGFPILAGILFVFSPLFILYCILSKKIKLFDEFLQDWLNYRYQVRSDKRSVARACFGSKTLNVKCTINFNEKSIIQNNHHKQKLIINRLKLLCNYSEKMGSMPSILE